MHTGDHLAGVGASQAEHQALHSLALAILGHHAVAGQGAKANLGQVANPHRAGAVGIDHNGPQVIQGADAALAAYQQDFVTFTQSAGTVVTVVGVDRVGQLLKAHAAGSHADGIWQYLEGPDLATEGVHIRHARYGTQRRPDHPVEQAATFDQRQGCTVHREHKHLAQRCGDRRHAATDAVRQAVAQVAETLGNLLPRPVDVSAILKIDGDIDQAVLGDRAQDLGLGNTEHFHFDRHGNPAFNFFRGHPRCLHDHLDLGAGHIREGIDGQPTVGIPARAGQQQRRQHHEQALGQRELDKTAQHHSPSSSSQAPFSAITPATATWSCSLMLPWTRTSCPALASTLTGRASKPSGVRTNTTESVLLRATADRGMSQDLPAA